MTVDEIKALPHYREPEVGAEVYVGTSLYLSHGADDFIGGIATIKSVEDRRDDGTKILDISRLSVTIEERPGWSYNWFVLMQEEPKRREDYGDRRAHADPDMTPEFNTGW